MYRPLSPFPQSSHICESSTFGQAVNKWDGDISTITLYGWVRTHDVQSHYVAGYWHCDIVHTYGVWCTITLYGWVNFWDICYIFSLEISKYIPWQVKSSLRMKPDLQAASPVDVHPPVSGQDSQLVHTTTNMYNLYKQAFYHVCYIYNMCRLI